MPAGTSFVAAVAATLKSFYAAFGAPFKDIGGPAMAFQAIKVFVFGKNFKTIEYPNGELNTLTLRWVSINALKKRIALSATDKPVNPKDIQMCRWVSPHFTEKLTNEKEMRQVGDDGWILWTRGSHIVIPPRFSIDKGFPVSDQITDNLLQTLERFLESPDENLRISQDDFDVLVVMTASKDETLFTGFRRYGKEPERFRNFALNHVNKKREGKKRTSLLFCFLKVYCSAFFLDVLFLARYRAFL
eukprot:GEZU01023935.1.p1 GENE.GEZU01023935.1~~GEZU01023935.1.p1  ORF type:complete len:245 (-),score=30.34 GEZU01023935.1:10-744(-)